jgi:SAM-dependent methyltransferase
MSKHASEHCHHGHDEVDWAAQAALMAAWDTIDARRNREITGWLGLGPGQLAVDVGSGAGGMAAEFLEAVGPEGTVVIVDGSVELLAVARRRAGRPDHHLVAVHADVDREPLGSVMQHPADLVYASGVVHHLDDELAAVKEFAAVVRPGGSVALAEGGLDTRFLPDDCGVGEPGLEQRLAGARDAWFWSEVRPAGPTVRRGGGWAPLLADAGLVEIATRSFLLDLPAPLDPAARAVARDHFERELTMLGDRISADDRSALEVLLDDDDPRSLVRRPDLFVLGVRTVYVGTVPIE